MHAVNTSIAEEVLAKVSNWDCKVKWCIYIEPFPCNMLKGALQ